MTKAQTKLIKQAATKEVDGESFRQRMDAWLDENPDRRLRDALQMVQALKFDLTSTINWDKFYESAFR